jgi:hypothetical protein
MTDWKATHPLVQAHARATALHGHLRVEFGLPTDAGWYRLDELFAAGSPVFAAQVRASEARLRTMAGSIIGSALLQSYQWPLIALTVGCYLSSRRVPNLHAGNVRIHLNAASQADGIALLAGGFTALASDPAQNHPDAHLVTNHAALQTILRRSLEEHLGQAIGSITAQLGGKPNGLWLNVADGLAGTLAWLMHEFDPTAELSAVADEVDALVRVADSPLNNRKIGLVMLQHADQQRVFLERATCCYWYKTEEGEYCSTCPHRTPEDRRARLIQYLAEEAVHA